MPSTTAFVCTECVCACVCASGQLRRREHAISPGSELPLWSAKAKQSKRDARPSQRGLNIPESGHHKFPSPIPPLHPSFPSSLPPPVFPGYQWVSWGAGGGVRRASEQEIEKKVKERVWTFKSQEDIWVQDFDCFTHTGQSLERSLLCLRALWLFRDRCVWVCARIWYVCTLGCQKEEDLFKRTVETVEGMGWRWKSQMKECRRSELLY